MSSSTFKNVTGFLDAAKAETAAFPPQIISCLLVAAYLYIQDFAVLFQWKTKQNRAWFSVSSQSEKGLVLASSANVKEKIHSILFKIADMTDSPPPPNHFAFYHCYTRWNSTAITASFLSVLPPSWSHWMLVTHFNSNGGSEVICHFSIACLQSKQRDHFLLAGHKE